MSNNTFLTYLCNDLFVPGAIALIKSLLTTKTKYSISCMITEDVSEESRDLLIKNGFNLINIEKIFVERTDGIKDRYKDNSWMMFSKLNIFKLVEYKKIVFLDADCIILKNIDEMFDFPSISAARDAGYGGLSAGVFVAEPSLKLYNEIINKLNSTDYDNTYSDQSFLNWFCTRNEIWNEISYNYNTLQKRFKIQNDTKIYHYNGQKPWINDKNNGCFWQMGKNDIYDLWQYYYKLEIKENI